MKNKEKFKDEIFKIACKGERFAINEEGLLVECTSLNCTECRFNLNDISNCRINVISWCEQEYENPKIQIPKDTPIDTEILVKDSATDIWKRRHFAGFDIHGNVLAWNLGQTSFTAYNIGDVASWDYAKLFNESEDK